MKRKLLTLMIVTILSAVMSPVFAQQADKACTLTPYDLRVEYMNEPRGIDEMQPRFSWKLKSDVQGDEQTAYRIVVWPAAKQKPVWDSKDVKSGNSVNIEYVGDMLQSGEKYEWSVIVTDKNGVESQPVVSNFSMGLFPSTLDANPWGDAKWIGYEPSTEETPTPNLSVAKWVWSEKPNANGDCRMGIATFRKTLNLPNDEITQASVAFTGDNSTKVFVNGELVSEGTNFHAAATCDVTAKLKSGKNIVAVEVNNLGETPNPAGMIGAIKVQFKNLPELNVVSDDSWKTFAGTTDGWSAVDFNDANWQNAVVIASHGGGPWGNVTVSQPRLDIPARYLEHIFIYRNPIIRATAHISGLGYYELYINDKRIGDHVLDPILKDYDVSVPYVTYEIDPEIFVKPAAVSEVPIVEYSGRRVAGSVPLVCNVAVTLGNGRYYAPRNNEPAPTKDYGFPKLLFKMVVEFANGSVEVVSNSDWRITTDGPIRGNNDYDGEIYDARLESNVHGKYPRLNEMSRRWQNAQLVEAPKGKLVAQNMPPMRVTEEIKPVSLKEVSPGVWVYDLGQNIVGWCRLKVKGESGTEIKLRHAETTLDDGHLYVANLRGAKCRDIYICNGDPNGETYEPRFSYHGFRYVELTGYPGTPTLDTITGCIVHTDLPFAGKFECSNALVNQIHKNIFWGTRGNYLSVPTDCPQRDERQGWQGDRAAESLGEMFLFDNVTLYSKWLQDIEESQTPEGNLSDVCPPFWPLYGRNVTWPSAFTIVPESIYKQYGDDRPIRRHYDAMARWMKFLEADIHDGIIEVDNYGDWCVPPERKELIHSQDPARKTDKGILATSYYIHNLNLLTRYARMLKKWEDAKYFAKKAALMSDAFNKKYYDASTGKYDNGTQTSCVLPLYFGLVPEGEREKVFASLMNNIENVTDYHIGTGLIGGQWLNRVLTEFGRADIGWRFVTNKTYPSWGYMVENGATTVWELWNGNTADPAMNSGNHVMLVGDLTIWLYQNLAGIKSDDGFRSIDMAPIPVGDLTFVKAEYESVRGMVKSHWQRKDGQFVWEVVIPVGATANLTVPTENPNAIYVNDRATKPNAIGKIVLGSGSYRVTAPAAVRSGFRDAMGPGIGGENVSL